MTHDCHRANICRYVGILILLVILSAGILPATAAPLTSNRHIFINVANDAGVKFDLDGVKYGGPSNTYYIKADGGGLNELHITNDANDAYGQVTTTSNQSGVFYISNTGGRGFDNDIILLVAVQEPVPDDFSVTIKSSGYTWTPAPSGAYTPLPPTDYIYVPAGVSETFSKPDFIYGPQNWKPGPGALGALTLPIFNGEDMADTSNQFRLMFVDLNAGNMYPNKFPGVTLEDNGAVKVEYSFTNLHTFASFNGYGWCSAANQNQGISWTNPTRGFDANGGAKQSGQSGYSVTGITSSGPSVFGWAGGAELPVPGSEVPVNADLYGYKGKAAGTAKSGSVNGSILFFVDPDAEPVLANNRIRNFNLTAVVPPGSNITLARMYLYISDSQYIQGGMGISPSFSVMLNTTLLKPDMMYIDADGDDKKQVSATCAYDVRELLNKNGTYTFSVRNTDLDNSVFTIDNMLLVTAYEQENAPDTRYWIHEGCDVVLSQPEKGLFPEDSETGYPFSGTVNMSTARDAHLYLVATGLDSNMSTDHTVRFNDGKWNNVFDNGSSFEKNASDNVSIIASNNATVIMQIPVSLWINETENSATVQSSIRSADADYLVNRNAILIVENQDSRNSSNSTAPQAMLVPSSGNPDSSTVEDENSCCRITLDSDPEGALVFIDGMYSGKTTPDTVDVQKGDTHTVRFELDGFSPADVQFIAMNSTTIRESLYTPVHSTKGRLAEEPDDPDGIRYGGLYIHSRPHSATISINGISTGKTAPAVFMGLEPGSYTINLGKVQDIAIQENDLFVFPDQTVYVQPGVLTLADINGIGNHLYSDMIIDSRRYRGETFTINGVVNNKTVPARVSAPLFNSYITIHDNDTYVSSPVPVPYVWDEDRYLLFEPRGYQNLSIAVTSSPRGAEIFLDGFRTGYATPYTFRNISDGPHWVMVTKNGYLPQQSPVYLPVSTSPVSMTYVNFELEEYPSGFLYVDSIPAGAKVSIDRMYTGEITPALFKAVPTGIHLVEVEWTNKTKRFEDVTVNSVEMTRLTADFTPDED
jgi:hypothetical protein